jgi:hypothetical protein
MKACIALLFFLGSTLWLCAQNGEVRIERIYIRSLGAFDEAHEEFRSWPFQLANKFHVKTRDSFVREELLFREGDLLDIDVIRESERNLRRYAFLTDVRIEVRKTSGDSVDVYVNTEDQWTTKANITLGKSRGYHDYDFGFQEDNFLGLGKGVGVKYSKDVERGTLLASYFDPRFLNTRLRLQVRAGKSSDGYQSVFTLQQPFYSQEAHWSYGIHAENLKRTQHFYDQGHDVAQYGTFRNAAQLFFTRSWGDRHHHIRVGPLLGYDEALYSSSPALPAPDPVEHRLLNLGLALQADRQDFQKFAYLDKFGRVEDLPAGILGGFQFTECKDQMGPDFFIAAFSGRYTAYAGSHGYFVAEANLSAHSQKEGWNNRWVDLGARYYFQTSGAMRQTFATRISVTVAREMDAPFQLSLGEQEGLRGYPFKSFNGTSRVLFNWEDRIFAPWENRFFGVALVPFVDAGSVWEKEKPELGVGVGVGLRFGLKKYGRTKVFRIDVAAPLTSVEKHRISVSVSSDQLFNVL